MTNLSVIATSPLNIDSGNIDFSNQDMQALASFGKKLSFEKTGLKVFDQGDAAQKIYLLTEGVVRISRFLSDGSRHIVAFRWPGSFFGIKEEGSFVNHAHTLTPCVIYEFESYKFSNFLLSHPSLQQKVLQRAIYHISSNYRQIIIVGRLGTQRALAAFLLECSTQNGFFDAQKNILTIPMSRYDIADYLGTAAESVTRAITKLETQGVLQRIGARGFYLNVKALKDFASIE